MVQAGKPIASPGKTRELLRKNGLQANKRRGQNFLIDSNIVRKIIKLAEIRKIDTVIEVGSGLGGLTQGLAETGARILALEVDRGLVDVSRAELASFDNVRVELRDALVTNFDDFVSARCENPCSYKIVANLPYYITSPLIMHFLENCTRMQFMVLMMQKEVAARVTAKPGNREYGTLTVAVRFYSEAKLMAEIPRTVFYPEPKVDSALVKFVRRTSPPVKITNQEIFFKVVKAAFGKRRKTLLNALSNHFSSVDRDEWLSILEQAQINPFARAEQLDLGDFARLANSMKSND